MSVEPPETPEGPDPDALGPDTFRADLLHQRQSRLNKGQRILVAAGAALALLLLVAGVNVWRYFLADLPTVPSMATLGSLKREPGSLAGASAGSLHRPAAVNWTRSVVV